MSLYIHWIKEYQEKLLKIPGTALFGSSKNCYRNIPLRTVSKVVNIVCSNLCSAPKFEL